MFQSSPGLLAGRYGQTHPWPAIRFEVSILARPFGRALRSALSLSPPPPEEFLSSPGLLAGRDGQHGPRRTAVAGFNPRPAFWPGVCAVVPPVYLAVDVSILARPFGRVLRPKRQAMPSRAWFQSSPGLLAGRYICPAPVPIQPEGFNPRPAFWPGATPFRSPLCDLLWVSILARPFGRALRRLLLDVDLALASFNPRPAFWPACYGLGLILDLGSAQVSILARPFGRALTLELGDLCESAEEVSILARPFGRA